MSSFFGDIKASSKIFDKFQDFCERSLSVSFYAWRTFDDESNI